MAALLARLERRHEVAHLRLGRLTEADTGAMLAAVTGKPVSFRVVASLYRRTGGNPFFLEELLRAHSDIDLETLCESPLPWSLTEVLRQQVDDLDPDRLRIVEAAAVLGHRVPFDLLAAVTGASEQQLIEVLRELVTRGLLIESTEDEFTFRHALVREALTGQMLGRQRRRLHEAALDALLAGTVGGATDAADPALVAHHAEAAGRYDDMIAAARKGTAVYLAIGSAYQALQLAEMALDEVGDDTELLAAAARAAWLAGLGDDATAYACRWRDSADRAEERAEALYLLMRLSWESDDLADMERFTDDDIEALLDELPGPDRAQAMTVLSQSLTLRDLPDAAIEWADRALVLAEQLDLRRVQLTAQVEKGSALGDRPVTAQDGRQLLAGLLDEVEKLGEWVLAARALNMLVQIPLASVTEQAELLERMRIDAERAGYEWLAVASYYQGLARLALKDGDLDAAIDALLEGRAATASIAGAADGRTFTCFFPRRPQPGSRRPAAGQRSHRGSRGAAGPDAGRLAWTDFPPGLPTESAGGRRPAAHRGARRPRRTALAVRVTGPRPGVGRTVRRAAAAARTRVGRRVVDAGRLGRLAHLGGSAGSRSRRRDRGCPYGVQIRHQSRHPAQRRPGHRPHRRGPLPLPARPRPKRRSRPARGGCRRAARTVARLASRSARTGAYATGPGTPLRRTRGHRRGRPHPSRAGGGAPDRGRPHQQRTGPQALHLTENRSRPRIEHPAQTGPVVPYRGRQRPRQGLTGHPRRSAAGGGTSRGWRRCWFGGRWGRRSGARHSRCTRVRERRAGPPSHAVGPARRWSVAGGRPPRPGSLPPARPCAGWSTG
nr:hypothetical protein [Fodinicola feengrottensis]